MNYLFAPGGDGAEGRASEEPPAAPWGASSAQCRPCVVANVLWGATVLAAIGVVAFLMVRARRQQQQQLRAVTVLPLPPLPVRPKKPSTAARAAVAPAAAEPAPAAPAADAAEAEE